MSGLEEFCCICVKKYPHLESINETDENSVKYKDKLLTCTTDQKWSEDYNICKNCIEKLDLAYNFIQDCLQSERLRKEQLSILTEQVNKTEAENLICDKCKKQFKHKRTLTIHVKKAHTYKLKVKDPSEHNTLQSNEEKVIKSEAVEIRDHFSDNDENLDNFSSEEETDSQLLKKPCNRRKCPLTCEYCGKLFNRRQHYAAHIRSKHTFEKPYKCDLCDAKYTTSHSLLVHKRNHNNEKPFICSYCGKSFVCSGDLYHHSKIHLNKRDYKCTLCDKSFNTASILRTHKICMHVDPKNWKYICSFCNKRFPINSSLVTHRKRHTGIRDFICHICEKKFFDKSELSKHLKSHSNERQYKCNLCQGKEYKNNYGLKKHMKIVHNVGTIKIVKPEKKFTCHICPKAFAFNNKLQKHLCTHTGDKPFKCHVCEKRFIENYYRKLHLKKKHNIDSPEEPV